MKRSLLSLAILIAVSPSALGEEAAGYYLDRHAAGDIKVKETIESYAQAVEDGMGWSNSELKSAKRPLLYCLPENLSLTGSQILDLVRRQIAKQKPVAEAPFGLAIMHTLKEVFPCKNTP